MALAYPGESGNLCSIISRDAFLEALNPQLRLKIQGRDTEHATLEDALRVATRLEAVCKTADDEYVDEVKKRKRNIQGATQAPEARDAQAEKQIADLETAVGMNVENVGLMDIGGEIAPSLSRSPPVRSQEEQEKHQLCDQWNRESLKHIWRQRRRESPCHFYSMPQCSHCKHCTSYGNSVRLSVRPSVCHTPVLCQNDGT